MWKRLFSSLLLRLLQRQVSVGHQIRNILSTTTNNVFTDRISLPEIGNTRHDGSLLPKADRSQVFQSLEDLKKHVNRSAGAEQYRRAVQEVQEYLRADDVPQLYGLTPDSTCV